MCSTMCANAEKPQKPLSPQPSIGISVVPNTCIEHSGSVCIVNLSEWPWHCDHLELDCKADAAHTVNLRLNIYAVLLFKLHHTDQRPWF